MTHIEEMTERLKATSFSIAAFMEGELYLNEFEDQSENYTLAQIFPRILEMAIGELRELGIQLHYSTDDVYDNPRLISAVVALREIFDKDTLFNLLYAHKELKQMTAGIIDSLDIEGHQRGAKIIELLKHVGPADHYKLEEIDALEDGYSTNEAFKNHVTACIERCTPKSTATDADIVAFSQVGQAVAIIAQGWNAIWEVLKQKNLLPVPHETCANYFREFAQQWYRMEKAQTYSWMLSVTDQELKEHPVYQRGLDARYREWKEANPYLRDVRINPTIEFAAMQGIALTLVYLGGIWEAMKPVRNLLSPSVSQDAEEPEKHFEYIFTGYKGKTNEETSAAYDWWSRYSKVLIDLIRERKRD